VLITGPPNSYFGIFWQFLTFSKKYLKNLQKSRAWLRRHARKDNKNLKVAISFIAKLDYFMTRQLLQNQRLALFIQMEKETL
jgi:hypothetical protein